MNIKTSETAKKICNFKNGIWIKVKKQQSYRLKIEISRLTVVSHEAKKKQHAHVSSGLYATTTVSYLHGWEL